MMYPRHNDSRILAVHPQAEALDLARKGLLEACKEFRKAFDCLETCAEEYWGNGLLRQSYKSRGIIPDPEIFTTTLTGLTESLQENIDFNPAKLQGGFALLLNSLNPVIARILEHIPNNYGDQESRLYKARVRAISHMDAASHELGFVQSVVYSFSQVDKFNSQTLFQSSGRHSLASQHAGVLFEPAAGAEFFRANQLRAFLLRQLEGKECKLSELLKYEERKPISMPQLASYLSHAFNDHGLNSFEQQSLRATFLFFNPQQRREFGAYLCSVISPTFKQEVAEYVRFIDQFSQALCKGTGASVIRAELLERMSRHTLRIRGRSLSALVDNEVFAIEPNGAVLLQRINHSIFADSSSIAAITPFGKLPIFSGEITDSKWQRFANAAALKDLENLRLIPLTGGIAEYYELGTNNAGIRLPQAKLICVADSIPFYYAAFILEAVRPSKRSAAFF